MGILDMADQFCNPLNGINKMSSVNPNVKLENKLHEQPLVTFIRKDNGEDVIYREEV